MKISTSLFSEIQTAGKQDLLGTPLASMGLVVPGACTSCNGSTSTSCCCGVFSPNGGSFRGEPKQ